MSQSWTHQPWHDVAVFESLEAATALKIYLENKGFEARAYDDKAFRYFLFLRPPLVTFRVQVPRDRVDEAMKLVESERPAVLARAIHCPECDSIRVNYPQMTRRFVLPTVLLHLGILFRVVDHQCYCEHCHHMWSLSRDKANLRKVRDVKPFPF
jgi:hypothetical protein